VGIISTITTYAVLIIGVELMRVPVIPSSIVGYALGIVVNYVLNYTFTFMASEKHSIVFPRFMVVMSIGMATNAAVMYICNSVFGIHYLIAQTIAVGVVVAWSYTANRVWTFGT
jgi:putative flippase GtrA